MYRAEAYEQQRAQMRQDGNVVGGIVLLITAFLSLGFTVLAFVLLATGRLSAAQIAQEDLGLGKTGYMLLYMCTYTVFMGVPPLLVNLLFRRRIPRLEVPAAQRHSPTGVLAFFVGLGGCAAANMIASYVSAFLDSFGITPPENPTFLEATPQSFALNVVVLALLPALLEELAFRKCVLGTLQKYGNGTAVFVSAVLFGVIHGGIAQSVFAFVVGLILGWITVKTGSVRTAIAVHFANNALSLTAEYLTLGMDQTAQGLAYTFVIGVTGLCGIGALILSLAKRNALFIKAPARYIPSGALSVIWSAPLMVIATILLILRIFYTNLM